MGGGLRERSWSVRHGRSLAGSCEIASFGPCGPWIGAVAVTRNGPSACMR
jgi:hypothetical protein